MMDLVPHISGTFEGRGQSDYYSMMTHHCKKKERKMVYIHQIIR